MATRLDLRGLVLTAAELRDLTDWPDSLVEDYLNILNNLILLSNEIDTKGDFLKSTVRTTTNYVVLDTEEEIFANTLSGPITISLPAGVDGRKLRIHNIGEVGNAVTLVPNGTDLLFGDNSPEVLYDREVVIITFETDEGWD